METLFSGSCSFSGDLFEFYTMILGTISFRAFTMRWLGLLSSAMDVLSGLFWSSFYYFYACALRISLKISSSIALRCCC